MSRSWCNFREENHEESTCEVKKSVRDKIFGKKPETTIVVLDWVEPEHVMIINTRKKSYSPKGRYDSPRASSTPYYNPKLHQRCLHGIRPSHLTSLSSHY
jgi:hypothetical protein